MLAVLIVTFGPKHVSIDGVWVAIRRVELVAPFADPDREWVLFGITQLLLSHVMAGDFSICFSISA